jgi:hypothetical protein
MTWHLTNKNLQGGVRYLMEHNLSCLGRVLNSNLGSFATLYKKCHDTHTTVSRVEKSAPVWSWWLMFVHACELGTCCKIFCKNLADNWCPTEYRLPALQIPGWPETCQEQTLMLQCCRVSDEEKHFIVSTPGWTAKAPSPDWKGNFILHRRFLF